MSNLNACLLEAGIFVNKNIWNIEYYLLVLLCMKKRTFNIDLDLVRVLSSMKYNYTRELSYWYAMKYAFKNSCVYDFENLSSVSKKLNIPRNTARRHIQFFLDCKWAFLRDGNLCFVSFDTLRSMYVTKKYKKLIKVRYLGVRDLINRMRYGVLKSYYLRHQRISGCVRELNNTQSVSFNRKKGSYRTLKKLGVNLTEIENFDHDYRVSQKKIGARLGLSREGAKRAVNSLMGCGLENHGHKDVLIFGAGRNLKWAPSFVLNEVDFPFYRMPNKYVMN
jgi:biotin operon repressor